jgi:TPR repeat protein
MSGNQLISSRFIVILLLSIVCPAIFSCAGTVSPEPHQSNAIDVIDMAMAEEASKSLELATVSRSHEPVKGPSASAEPLKAVNSSFEVGQVSSREPVRGGSDSPELAKTLGKSHEPVRAVRKSSELEKPLSEPARAGSATANYLRKLAEAGDASAQNALGLLYYDGKGVPQSYGQAKAWFEKAAKQGHAGGQVNLGTLYLHGDGTPQSAQTALVWFKRSAAQRDALAFAKLGRMYERGQGVPQDLIQAQMWYTLSAAHGEQRAVEIRDALAHQMTAGQIAEAHRLAIEWKANDRPGVFPTMAGR